MSPQPDPRNVRDALLEAGYSAEEVELMLAAMKPGALVLGETDATALKVVLEAMQRNADYRHCRHCDGADRHDTSCLVNKSLRVLAPLGACYDLGPHSFTGAPSRCYRCGVHERDISPPETATGAPPPRPEAPRAETEPRCGACGRYTRGWTRCVCGTPRADAPRNGPSNSS